MLQTAVIQDQAHKGQPTYFAFISYKREDSKWALWLQKKLQNYRLPGSLLRGNKGLPKRLSPVFLDKLNLTPGELESSLREAVCDSKYLIVVCSRYTHDAPRYINDEIRYFLEGGNSPDRIIPFIVDPSQTPEEDCFPSMLQEICREKNLLGANIFEAGPRRAFIKVIARMHGLKTTELENSDARRRRGNIALLVSLCVLLATVGGMAINHYFIPHTAYYADYVQHRGIPQGIGKLNGDQMKYRANRYAITVLADRVVQLRYENSSGALQDHTHTEYTERPTKAEYSYGAWGGLDAVVYYNKFDQAVLRMEYSEDGKAIDLKEPDADYGGGFVRMDAGNIDQNVNDILAEDAGQKKIVRYLVEYGENGLETQRRYVGNPMYNTCTTDSHGIAGVRYEYDDLGRITRMENLLYTGKSGSALNEEDYAPGVNSIGVCGKKYEYENYTIVRTEYFDVNENPILNEQGWMVCEAEIDDWGNATREDFLDADGQRMLRSPGGYAGVTMEYDQETGNGIRTAYFGTNGEPVLSNEGIAGANLSYYDDGTVARVAYFGVAGEPVLHVDGNAGYTVEYQYGRESRVEYFGLNGELVLTQYGYAAYESNYDANGNLLKRMFFGTDFQPVLLLEGYAGWESEYDENGNEVKCMFLGTDGKPLLQQDGTAGWMSIYNLDGSEECIYLDEDGLPTLHMDGNAGWRKELDARGNTTRLLYFDLEGKPVILSDGYAGWESEYDENGNEVKRMFLGTDEQPLLQENGTAGRMSIYDENGNEILCIFLGVNGEPVRHADGNMGWSKQYDAGGNMISRTYLGSVLLEDNFAGIKYEYDAQGREIRRSYVDTNGEPVLYMELYSSATTEYDTAGNIVRLSALGPDDEPVLCENGYSVQRRWHDDRGNETMRIFLGTDGEPVLLEDGYAGWRSEYNEAGKEVKRVYLGTDEQPLLQADGYAGWRSEYDDAGNEIMRVYFGEDEQPLLQADGYAGAKLEYDTSGHVILLIYLGEDEQPLLQTDGYAGVKREYDASGNEIQRMYLGEDEQPLLRPDGFAGWRSEFDASGNEIKRVFLDANEQPLLQPEGYAGWRSEYDDAGNEIRRMYLGEYEQPLPRLHPARL